MGEATLKGYILGKNNLITFICMLLAYIDSERWYVYSGIFVVNWIFKVTMALTLRHIYRTEFENNGRFKNE